MSDEKKTTIVLSQGLRSGVAAAKATPAPAQPTPVRGSYEAQVMRLEVLKLMAVMPIEEALPIALSYVIAACEASPELLRKLMLEPVMKEGFRGIPLMTYIKRAID
jgi:hypothetical protein